MEVETLKPNVHRNYLPGSADYKTVNTLAPSVSSMKDAVAYFGLRGVFGKCKVR